MTHQLKLSSLRKTSHTQTRGFTIVELLIVIVVIGILAALVLNTFSGAQRSARNAQTAHAIEAYKKGLIAYAVINGAYPNFDSGCLGQGYPGGNCWAGVILENIGLSTALKTTMGSTLPFPGLGGNATFGSIFINTGHPWALTLDGVPRAFILYNFDTTGDANPKCPVGPIVGNAGNPNWLTSNPVGGTSNGGNQCYVPLPDATKL